MTSTSLTTAASARRASRKSPYIPTPRGSLEPFPEPLMEIIEKRIAIAISMGWYHADFIDRDEEGHIKANQTNWSNAHRTDRPVVIKSLRSRGFTASTKKCGLTGLFVSW